MENNKIADQDQRPQHIKNAAHDFIQELTHVSRGAGGTDLIEDLPAKPLNRHLHPNSVFFPDPIWT